MGSCSPREAVEPGRDGLQALRVAAVGMLLAYHAALLAEPSATLAGRTLEKVGAMGWIGTDLLLALAGFLAVGAHARAGGARAWLARRAARVLPLLFAFLLVYLYVVPLALSAAGRAELAATFAEARARQLWAWGLATNLQMAAGGRPGVALEPLLTLALGAQLTVCAALLLSSSRRGLLPLVAIAVECAAIALRFAWRHDDVWRTYCFPLTRCDAFLAGMAVAWASAEPRWAGVIRRHARAIAAGGAAVLLLAVIATKGLPVHSSTTSLLGYPAIGVFSGTTVLWLAHGRPWRARLATRLGDAMFAVYLVKLPVLFAVRELLLRAWPVAGARGGLLLAAAGGAAAVAVGGALHLWVERPLVGAAFAVVARRPHAWARPGPAVGLPSGSAR